MVDQAAVAALAERGIGMVDAPVSGPNGGAQTAELVFMVGGPDNDVARVRPLLEVLGHEVSMSARSVRATS